jgi:hypothetical protein
MVKFCDLPKDMQNAIDYRIKMENSDEKNIVSDIKDPEILKSLRDYYVDDPESHKEIKEEYDAHLKELASNASKTPTSGHSLPFTPPEPKCGQSR